MLHMLLRCWPKAFFLGSLTFSLIIAGVAIWGEGGWLDIRAPNGKLAQLEAQSKILEEENRRIKAEIKTLRSSHQVEKIAREELGMVKPGEIVYEFIERGKELQSLRLLKGASKDSSLDK